MYKDDSSLNKNTSKANCKNQELLPHAHGVTELFDLQIDKSENSFKTQPSEALHFPNLIEKVAKLEERTSSYAEIHDRFIKLENDFNNFKNQKKEHEERTKFNFNAFLSIISIVVALFCAYFAWQAYEITKEQTSQSNKQPEREAPLGKKRIMP